MAFIIFIILVILGCLSAGFLLGDTYRSNEPKSMKISAWILYIVMAILAASSLLAYKELIVSQTVLDHYKIEKKTETTITYNVIKK